MPDCIFCSLDLNPEVCYDGDLSDSETLDGLWATFEATGDYAVDFPMRKAKYIVGDYLYVRETWAPCATMESWLNNANLYAYRADCEGEDHPQAFKWRPSIHMPKEAARIFLRVTDVRVERLWEITDEQARKEGCVGVHCNHPNGRYACEDCMNTGYLEPPVAEFHEVWNTTIKKQDIDKYGWESNPWVWVYEFERVEEG